MTRQNFLVFANRVREGMDLDRNSEEEECSFLLVVMVKKTTVVQRQKD